jgi:hypothetical protein
MISIIISADWVLPKYFWPRCDRGAWQRSAIACCASSSHIASCVFRQAFVFVGSIENEAPRAAGTLLLFNTPAWSCMILLHTNGSKMGMSMGNTDSFQYGSAERPQRRPTSGSARSALLLNGGVPFVCDKEIKWRAPLLNTDAEWVTRWLASVA